jgi:2-polyprenyl-3-methyl-5-hydroxy-6-metoxy-1,4-benzoquinol methylase
MIAQSSVSGRCPVCGSCNGELLEPPHPSRSVTSGGIVIETPLRKVQCLECGLLRQHPHSEEAKTEFYRDKYALYHQRPGTSASENARYAAMAEWILAELAPHTPSSVLDVGCGGGLLLEALKRIHPSAEYAGIDPSIENSALARARGFSVATGFTPGISPPRDQYDVVVTANVVSHISDPLEFLSALASMTARDGRMVIFSHNGCKPSADHLWADVEFSFCREHLGVLGAEVGLELLEGRHIAPPQSQLDKHVLIFQHSRSPPPVSPLGLVHRDKLLEGRRRYFKTWRQLADRLAARAHTARGPVLNFGASFWSMLLAAYCPEYWDCVKACIVDEGGAGSFLGKPVMATEKVARHPRPLIVLGVNPASHAALAQQLSDRGDFVIWNDLITC